MLWLAYEQETKYFPALQVEKKTRFLEKNCKLNLYEDKSQNSRLMSIRKKGINKKKKEEAKIAFC